MKKCAECGTPIRPNHKISLCSDCFDRKLKEKIMNEDREVESPHASWF